MNETSYPRRLTVDEYGERRIAVHLEQSEVAPCCCEHCDCIYSVEEDSESSVCPTCGEMTIHEDACWSLVREVAPSGSPTT